MDTAVLKIIEIPAASAASTVRLTEELQTENEQQREELRELHRQKQIDLSDNHRLSEELQDVCIQTCICAYFAAFLAFDMLYLRSYSLLQRFLL